MSTQLNYMKNEILNELFEGKVINFEILKKYLEKRLGKKHSELNSKMQDIKKRLKKNELICDFFEGFQLFLLFSFIIAGIFSSVGFLGLKCYELNIESIALANKEVVDEGMTLLYALGGFVCGLGAVGIVAGIIYTMRNYGTEVSDFFRNISKKINTLRNKLQFRLSKQPVIEYKATNQNLHNVKTIIGNLDKIDACYNYMIHSSLKYKTFTEDEVELLFNLLMEGYDNNSLIYLLYHDRLQEFKTKNNRERQELIDKINIKGYISMVKEHSIHLEQLRQKEFEQTSVKQRKRRTTKPYDDKIGEYNNYLESVINTNLGGKHR